MKPIKPIFKLTKEEQIEHNAILKSDYISKPLTTKRRKEFLTAANNTIAKNKMITIRLSERNLLRIKAAAAREGLPYQTYITSIIHKYVS